MFIIIIISCHECCGRQTLPHMALDNQRCMESELHSRLVYRLLVATMISSLHISTSCISTSRLAMQDIPQSRDRCSVDHAETSLYSAAV